MISRMEKGRKYGQMELNIEVNISRVKNMEEEYSNGLMVLFMKESFRIIIYKAKESIVGLMVANT